MGAVVSIQWERVPTGVFTELFSEGDDRKCGGKEDVHCWSQYAEDQIIR